MDIIFLQNFYYKFVIFNITNITAYQILLSNLFLYYYYFFFGFRLNNDSLGESNLNFKKRKVNVLLNLILNFTGHSFLRENFTSSRLFFIKKIKTCKSRIRPRDKKNIPNFCKFATREQKVTFGMIIL